jgi:hypothetical protein
VLSGMKLGQKYHLPVPLTQQHSIMRRFDISIGLLSVAVIFWGTGYAIGRERLRDTDHLHDLYQKTNMEFFGGQLQDVEVKAYDLSEEKAEGITYREAEDSFVIVLDPHWNTSEAEALDTIRHESCHVAIWGQEPEEHGPLFQDCMKRFE